MDILEHGVFTCTRLNPGNSHVDRERFNRATLYNDKNEIAKVLRRFLEMRNNPSVSLT